MGEPLRTSDALGRPSPARQERSACDRGRGLRDADGPAFGDAEVLASTRLGRVEAERSRFRCRSCGGGCFPPDRAPGLEGETVTPGMASVIAGTVPLTGFEAASRHVDSLAGADASPSSLQRRAPGSARRRPASSARRCWTAGRRNRACRSPSTAPASRCAGRRPRAFAAGRPTAPRGPEKPGLRSSAPSGAGTPGPARRSGTGAANPSPA